MANKLLDTDSLYLRKHAHNPINWWYWGEEALHLAKTQDKPIFLSIGYSSCHWCTVMEGEAFSDSAIAQYLNEHFIAIKVDREERPDIDSIYMTALQMMTGQGGWPLNIFLTPDDLVPFYGGTYFPIESRYNRPAFLQILQALNDFYHHQKDKLLPLKEEIVKGLVSNSQIINPNNQELTPDLLKQAIENNSKVIARNDYNSPRFPMMPYTNLILQGGIQENTYQQLALKRALDLVNGGIYDHVGGGFHRYTVDATWTVPHFEKMLYDNGLIMEFLANLWSAGEKKPDIKRACEGTLQWLKREMTAEKGYFYASQDADNFANKDDNEPEEGDFYVWEYEQLKAVLSSEELETLEDVFMITEKGNFEGKNVLQKRENKEIDKKINSILDKLFTLRYGENRHNLITFPPAKNNQEAKTFLWQGRIPPVTDTKMILSWNSLMISGLARAYGVFGVEDYLISAEKAMKFILENQWHNGKLYRLNYGNKISILAQGEDYALLIKALLDLAQNHPTQQDYYLNHAVKVQTEFDQHHQDFELGGYYNNSLNDSQNLLIKEKNYIDNATPSVNGIAVANLIRLSLFTDNLDYLDQGEKTLKLFQEIMDKSSVSCPTLFIALNWYLNGSSVKTNSSIKTELNQKYLPLTVLKISNDLPLDRVGIVCRGLSCLEPAKDIQQILTELTTAVRNH